MLVAGKVEHALLLEPLSSVVLYKNAQKGKTKLVRSLNISDEWRKTFIKSPKLPQAGIIANTTINSDTQLVSKVNTAYKNAAIWCESDISACADIIKKFLPKMPKPALISAIRNTGLNVINSKDAQKDLQAFYQLLADNDAKRIGGKLPDDNFYF